MTPLAVPLHGSLLAVLVGLEAAPLGEGLVLLLLLREGALGAESLLRRHGAEGGGLEGWIEEHRTQNTEHSTEQNTVDAWMA